MTQRRSLASAMEITPEKAAFIQGMRPGSADDFSEQPAAAAVPLATPPRTRINKTSQPRTSSVERDRETEKSLLGVLLVPLTTRLQPKTADALRRAYLEQKLRRQTPDTQQEIIEAALQKWLRTEGYL